jgi:SAM-dependent methyltransferase
VTPTLRKWLFETLYKNRYLYRFASTVPFAGQWRVWQRLVLSRLYGHDILELGCGLGDLLADMFADGYNCRAVEHSPQMAVAARDTLRKRRLGSPEWVIQGTSQDLPFPSASFDTVVSTFPSEYIYDPATIAEVARVLRPGGRLIVIEGANLLPVGFVQPLLVGVQTLVYGLPTRKQRHEERNDETAARAQTNNAGDVITEETTDAWFGQHIPLESAGLRRRSQQVRSQRWEVYLTLGEK